MCLDKRLSLSCANLYDLYRSAFGLGRLNAGRRKQEKVFAFGGAAVTGFAALNPGH